LALGGGAVLGAAHIGVLKALDELDISIDYIAGTSAGALIASLFAFGNNWRQIEEIALDLDWFDISELNLSKYGLLSNDKLRKIIVEKIGDVKISESQIPLSIIATDICSGEKVILQEENLGYAVKASTCIPGVFHRLRLMVNC
jgi:NTE family protein